VQAGAAGDVGIGNTKQSARDLNGSADGRNNPRSLARSSGHDELPGEPANVFQNCPEIIGRMDRQLILDQS
jgi:hypothetical protein